MSITPMRYFLVIKYVIGCSASTTVTILLSYDAGQKVSLFGGFFVHIFPDKKNSEYVQFSHNDEQHQAAFFLKNFVERIVKNDFWSKHLINGGVWNDFLSVTVTTAHQLL